MKVRAEEFITEIEKFNLPGLEKSLKTSEAVRELKIELDSLIIQLKTVVKVGDFDGFLEREAPKLIGKIEVKKNELKVAIANCKAKEIQKAEWVAKSAAVSLKDEKRTVKSIYENPSPRILRTSVQDSQVQSRKAKGFAYWTEMSTENISFFVAVGVLVVVVQIVINVFYVGKIKTNLQYSVVEPLEKRLQFYENKNAELTKTATDLQRKVTFFQNVNMKFQLTKPVVTAKVKAPKVSSKTSLLQSSSRARKPANQRR